MMNMFNIIILLIAISSASASELRRVAVVDFNDMTGSEMGAQVGENFRTALAATGTYLMIERAQIEDVLTEQKFQYSDLTDMETASAFGKVAGAEYVVVGSITRLGSEWTFNARMINVENTEVTCAAQARGDGDFAFFDMIDTLVVEFAGSADSLVASEEVYYNDFSTYLLGAAKLVGEGKYGIDTNKKILTLGDGKGTGEQMRCGIEIPISEQDSTVDFNFRFERDGDFAIYGRVADDTTTIARIVTGYEIENADYRYNDSNPFFGMPYYYGYNEPVVLAGVIMGSLAMGLSQAFADDPDSGNIGLFEYNGTEFLSDEYENGLPRSSSTHNFNISSADIDKSRWYSVTVVYRGDEMTLRVAGKELILPIDENAGSIVLAVFDDAIVEISSLAVSTP